MEIVETNLVHSNFMFYMMHHIFDMPNAPVPQDLIASTHFPILWTEKSSIFR
jgi:hypothetical protein